METEALKWSKLNRKRRGKRIFKNQSRKLDSKEIKNENNQRIKTNKRTNNTHTNK